MDAKAAKILRSLKPNKVILPILIGIVAVGFMFFSGDDFNFEDLVAQISSANLFWVFMAFVVLIARDLGYMYRIRHLTDKTLNWVSSFFVVILWEFASAITPSVVGGTAVAIFIINREGIKFGKSLAYVMLTAVLDNLFFVFASIAVLLLLPSDIFPDLSEITESAMSFPLRTAFIVSVSLIGLYTFLMSYGLFFQPRGFKWLLVFFTSNRFLRRWRSSAAQTGNDVIMASKVLKGKGLDYWLPAIGSTLFIWSARYFMLNCLIAAFTPLNPFEHMLVFSRQIAMWVVMLISPTPGSTGTAEYFFSLFFGEFFTVAGLTLAVALFWRIFTYYAYLILGVSFLPRWIRRVFAPKPQEVEAESQL